MEKDAKKATPGASSAKTSGGSIAPNLANHKSPAVSEPMADESYSLQCSVFKQWCKNVLEKWPTDHQQINGY